MIEAWFNDDAAITGRVYPTLTDAKGLAVFSRNAPGMVKQMHIWEVESIWPNGSGMTC